MKPSQLLNLLKQTPKESLTHIKGVGGKLADNIVEFFESDKASTLIKKFELLESSGKAPGLVVPDTTVASKGVICITGSFDVSRTEISLMLEQKGYKITPSITKETTILLAGEDSGSKLQKAQSLGIQISNDYTLL